MCRWVAKNIVAAQLADRVEIQAAYAIGYPEPTSITIDCFGTEKVSEVKIEKAILDVFSFKPADIVSQLDLLRPIYRGTTHYGHFGKSDLPWEQMNKADDLKNSVG
jgi:S-adenosylmethionine synthetase